MNKFNWILASGILVLGSVAYAEPSEPIVNQSLPKKQYNVDDDRTINLAPRKDNSSYLDKKAEVLAKPLSKYEVAQKQVGMPTRSVPVAPISTEIALGQRRVHGGPEYAVITSDDLKRLRNPSIIESVFNVTSSVTQNRTGIAELAKSIERAEGSPVDIKTFIKLDDDGLRHGRAANGKMITFVSIAFSNRNTGKEITGFDLGVFECSENGAPCTGRDYSTDIDYGLKPLERKYNSDVKAEAVAAMIDSLNHPNGWSNGARTPVVSNNRELASKSSLPLPRYNEVLDDASRKRNQYQSKPDYVIDTQPSKSEQ